MVTCHFYKLNYFLVVDPAKWLILCCNKSKLMVTRTSILLIKRKHTILHEHLHISVMSCLSDSWLIAKSSKRWTLSTLSSETSYDVSCLLCTQYDIYLTPCTHDDSGSFSCLHHSLTAVLMCLKQHWCLSVNASQACNQRLFLSSLLINSFDVNYLLAFWQELAALHSRALPCFFSSQTWIAWGTRKAKATDCRDQCRQSSTDVTDVAKWDRTMRAD